MTRAARIFAAALTAASAAAAAETAPFRFADADLRLAWEESAASFVTPSFDDYVAARNQAFMEAVPENMRHLPLYITETDENKPWANANSGWVRRAYAEIDGWNQQPGHQQIRALILYRWPKIDQWVIEGKGGVIDDFRGAIAGGYRWRDTPPPPPAADWRPGDFVAATANVNLRRSPGHVGKAHDDALVAGGLRLAFGLVVGAHQHLALGDDGVAVGLRAGEFDFTGVPALNVHRILRG